MTSESIRTDATLLLDLTDFFDHLLLPLIQDSALNDPRFANALRIVNQLVNIPSAAGATLQGKPFLFDMDRVNTLCRRVTAFIRTREDEDAQVDLADMEVAVALQKKLALSLEKYCPAAEVKHVVQELIQCDGKLKSGCLLTWIHSISGDTSMLWIDCIYALGLKASCAGTEVPETPDPEIRLSASASIAVRTLLGDAYEPHLTFVDGAMVAEMSSSTAISTLMKACRESKILMDHIFEVRATAFHGSPTEHFSFFFFVSAQYGNESSRSSPSIPAMTIFSRRPSTHAYIQREAGRSMKSTVIY